MRTKAMIETEIEQLESLLTTVKDKEKITEIQIKIKKLIKEFKKLAKTD